MRTNRYFSTAALLLLLLTVTHSSVKGADKWVQVRSKNFFLIGNASEKDIKRVATRLEQFRETFRQLFSGINLTGSVPTNVVVFKSAGSYKPFKPKRGDGKADTGIAGYFQPGEDVNYITLSTEGTDEDTYGTIFHEYVHFIMNANFSKSDIPLWFNEGIAEYYQTFQIEEDIRVKLGLPQGDHLTLLNQNKLMPLDSLFNATHQQVHGTGGHSRSIFYSQSWALVHYLLQSGKTDSLGKFLGLLINGAAPETAFKQAFQMDYVTMEKELRAYIGKATYRYNLITFKNKLIFETEMQAMPMDDSLTNAYLGDLLYHSNRPDDAEPYLANSLKLDPASSMANTAMGMVKIRQRKWGDARGFLEKALASDPRNHIAYYRYAYLLSREGQDEFGFSSGFPAETATKMRAALKKAIEIEPKFNESYEMLAFVALVTGEELDEAIRYLGTALKNQPGNQRYALRAAEIYARQNKLKEAEAIAAKIAKTTDDDEARTRAESLLSRLGQQRQFQEQITAAGGRITTGPALPTTGGGPPRLTRRVENEADAYNRSINGLLRPIAAGEERTIGKVQKIECSKGIVTYSVISPDGQAFKLTSKDFDEVAVQVYDAKLGTATVACNGDISTYNAVITWQPVPQLAARGATPPPRGRLVSLEFVPADFRIMTEEETTAAAATVVVEAVPVVGPPTRTTEMPADAQAAMRQMMIDRIREALRKPGDGEKRDIGFLEKIECSGKDRFMHLRTKAGVLKLAATTPPAINAFTPDLAGVQFGCGMKPLEFPAVFVYADKPKGKVAGVLVSLDFVPRSFELN